MKQINNIIILFMGLIGFILYYIGVYRQVMDTAPSSMMMAGMAQMGFALLLFAFNNRKSLSRMLK
jgi:hypothetical protein